MDDKALADEYAVRNLYAAFAATIDAADANGFADCFADEGVLQFFNLGAVEAVLRNAPSGFLDDQGRVVGRRNLEAFVRFVSDLPGISIALHVASNIWIKSLDGGHGEGEAAFIALSGVDGSIGSFGRLYDKFSRGDDGRWRFNERREVFAFMRGA